MSVVVAIKEKDRVVVGCDTRMSSDETYSDSYEARPKAIKLLNGTIIAVVGNVGLLEIVKNEVAKLQRINRETISSRIVLPLFEKLRGTPFFNCHELDGSILIAERDTAYIISPIGTVEEINHFNAIGSGKLAALGSLFVTINSNIETEKKVKIAIEAAGTNVPSVSKEAWVADTRVMGFHMEE